MENSKASNQEQPQAKNFRFDSSHIEWKDFLTDGTYYRILDVNIAAQTTDILVKFEPGARCLYHRHVAATTTLVLEGELHVFDQTAEGVVHKVKPAGSFSSGAEDEQRHLRVRSHFPQSAIGATLDRLRTGTG